MVGLGVGRWWSGNDGCGNESVRKSRFAEERGGGYLLFCRDEALAQSLPFSEGREGKEQLQRYFGEPMGRRDSLGKYPDQSSARTTQLPE